MAGCSEFVNSQNAKATRGRGEVMIMLEGSSRIDELSDLSGGVFRKTFQLFTI